MVAKATTPGASRAPTACPGPRAPLRGNAGAQAAHAAKALRGLEVVEGSVEDGRFVAADGRDGVTVAALCRLAGTVGAMACLVADGVPFPPQAP